MTLAFQRRVRLVKKSTVEKLGRPFTLIAVEPLETAITISDKRIRDYAFTDAVREVYDNACAGCNFKISISEGTV
jgi:hypothetical protein